MKKLAYFLWISLSAFFCLNSFAFANMIEVQPAGVRHTGSQWSMLVLQGKILGEVEGYFEFQPRYSFEDSSQDRIMIRPALFQRLGNGFSLWVGYAGFGPNDGSSPWEHRMWQQVQHETQWGGVIVINRSRLEQRFLPNTEDVGHRIRHMVRTLVPLDEQKVWAVVFSDEVFFNLNSPQVNLPTGFDQNRAFGGISWNLGSGFRIEGGYINIWNAVRSEFNHVGLVVLNYLF